MPKLIFSKPGEELPHALDLQPGLNRLGRNPTNDFRIPDASISSFHCELVAHPDSIEVKDLNSTNGTFINGKPVREGVLLPGQTLQLGSVVLTFAPSLEPVPHVAIPEMSAPAEKRPVVHADGSLGCVNHPEAGALFQCRDCHDAFCDSCVRALRRAGASGATLYFCTNCPGQCDPIVSTSNSGKKKASLLGRLTQTLKLTFKR